MGSQRLREMQSAELGISNNDQEIDNSASERIMQNQTATAQTSNDYILTTSNELANQCPVPEPSSGNMSDNVNNVHTNDNPENNVNNSTISALYRETNMKKSDFTSAGGALSPLFELEMMNHKI